MGSWGELRLARISRGWLVLAGDSWRKREGVSAISCSCPAAAQSFIDVSLQS